MAASITIDNIDPRVFERVQAEARKHGVDMGTALSLLLTRAVSAGAVDRSRGPRRSLQDLAGTWTEDDLQEFEAATAAFERIDEGCSA